MALSNIEKHYNKHPEDLRLQRRHGIVEFETTMHHLRRYINPDMQLLDIGAGTGRYTSALMAEGYNVKAVELVRRNIEVFLKREPTADVVQGDARNMPFLPTALADVTLLLGPLYHLHSEKDRDKALLEANRVLKKEGVLFVAFINNDMIPYTEWNDREDYLLTGDYDKDTFKAGDFPFVFMNLKECRDLLARNGLQILRSVASDGMSELLEEKIDKLDDDGYAQYLKMHLFYCEREEHLGKTNHFLFVTKKR